MIKGENIKFGSYAFSSTNTFIAGKAGSTLETYAKECSYPFYAIAEDGKNSIAERMLGILMKSPV